MEDVMTLNPRQRRLLNHVRTHLTISVDDLAQQLNVTPQTVRRDVRQMEQARLLARALTQHAGLHVVTNNLNVAAILADDPQCEVIVAGGVVRSRDRGIVGEATIDFIRQFRVDIGIIGISSVEADGTLRDFDPREVKVAQAIIEQSRAVWLVADCAKFGR